MVFTIVKYIIPENATIVFAAAVLSGIIDLAQVLLTCIPIMSNYFPSYFLWYSYIYLYLNSCARQTCV